VIPEPEPFRVAQAVWQKKSDMQKAQPVTGQPPEWFSYPFSTSLFFT